MSLLIYSSVLVGRSLIRLDSRYFCAECWWKVHFLQRRKLFPVYCQQQIAFPVQWQFPMDLIKITSPNFFCLLKGWTSQSEAAAETTTIVTIITNNKNNDDNNTNYNNNNYCCLMEWIKCFVKNNVNNNKDNNKNDDDNNNSNVFN